MSHIAEEMAEQELSERPEIDPDDIGGKGWWCESCGELNDSVFVVETHVMDGMRDVKLDEHYLCAECYEDVKRVLERKCKRGVI